MLKENKNTRLELHIWKSKDGNKKIRSMFVREIKEFYKKGSSRRSNDILTSIDILESYKLSDTKPFQEQIDSLIKNLEFKYDIIGSRYGSN